MSTHREHPKDSDFEQRKTQGELLVDIIQKHYWQAAEIRSGVRFLHQPNGYEHLVSEETRLKLRERYDEDAKQIRFRPDALVRTSGDEGSHIFIEYKSTTTPSYRFDKAQWQIGQIEADPWENYLSRIRDGERIAILNYCPYHPRPLLCDYPTRRWIYGERQEVGRR